MKLKLAYNYNCFPGINIDLKYWNEEVTKPFRHTRFWPIVTLFRKMSEEVKRT